MFSPRTCSPQGPRHIRTPLRHSLPMTPQRQHSDMPLPQGTGRVLPMVSRPIFPWLPPSDGSPRSTRRDASVEPHPAEPSAARNLHAAAVQRPAQGILAQPAAEAVGSRSLREAATESRASVQDALVAAMSDDPASPTPSTIVAASPSDSPRSPPSDDNQSSSPPSAYSLPGNGSPPSSQTVVLSDAEEQPGTPIRQVRTRKAETLESTPPKRRRLIVTSRASTESASTEEKKQEQGALLRCGDQTGGTRKGKGKASSPRCEDQKGVTRKEKAPLPRLKPPRCNLNEVGRRELALTEVPIESFMENPDSKSALPENGEDQPRVRPKRVRMAPLEFWRNERVLNQRKPGDECLSVVGVLKNCAPHSRTDPRQSPDTRWLVTDSRVHKFQGLNGSTGVITDGVCSEHLSNHTISLPQWLKYQKHPPTVVLPGRGVLIVTEGKVRLAATGPRENMYTETILRKGDVINTSSSKFPRECQLLVAPQQSERYRTAKGLGAVLKLAIVKDFAAIGGHHSSSTPLADDGTSSSVN